jgi:hypothetical protein
MTSTRSFDRMMRDYDRVEAQRDADDADRRNPLRHCGECGQRRRGAKDDPRLCSHCRGPLPPAGA